MGGLEAMAGAWFAVAARITVGLAVGSLMVAAVLRKFPKISPEARHGLWVLVLLQGLLWFRIPIWVPASAQPEDPPVAQAASPPAVPAMPIVGQRSDEIPPKTVAEAASPPQASEADIGPKWAIPWRLVLAGVWAAGAVLLVLVTALRFWRARFHVMAGATPVPRSLQQSARELARRHGYHRRFHLLWSECCQAPMLIGLMRGTIVLPRWLAALPEGQAQALVAHEVAHLCRRDRLFALLSFASCVLNYFNPFAWWAERRMSASREASADRWVTQTAGYSRKDYGRGLVAVAEAISRAQPGWLGTARRSSELRQRIQLMQEPEAGRTRGQPWPAWILGASLAAAVVVSLISVRQSPPALAEDLPGEADGRVDPTAQNGRVRGPRQRPARPRPDEADRTAGSNAARRRSPTPRATAWGRERGGISCRARVPVEIEQGMRLPAKVELRSDPEKLEPGVKQLNTFLPAAFLELSLSDRQTAKTFTVRPDDPTRGMPVFDSGEDTAPLDGTAIEPWEIGFPLARLYDTLQPGIYQCHVQYSFPSAPTRFWHRSPEEWQAAGFWQGTVVSGTFDLKVLPETPKTVTLLLPKRLRVEKELVQLRADDEKRTAVPVIRFRSADAEKVTVPVRNGHFLAAKYYRNDEFYMLSAPPKPDDVNHVGIWYDYKGGDRQVTYTVEVFETCDPPMHMWRPGPGSGGYKVLWKKTLPVSVSEKQFRELRATTSGLLRPDLVAKLAGIPLDAQKNEGSSGPIQAARSSDTEVARPARLATQGTTPGSNLVPFKKDGLYGYKDDSGTVVITPRFALSAVRFSEGLAWVKELIEGESEFGYIDSAGKMVIRPQFDGADDFSEGLAQVVFIGHLDAKGEFHRGTGGEVRYGFIDKSGTMVIAPRFHVAGRFCEGLARAREPSSSKRGYIGKTGRWVISPQFSDCGNFYKGLAPAAVGDVPGQWKWGFIDKTGRFEIPPKYLWANEFSIIHQDRGQVGIDANHWGYIDSTGRIVERHNGPYPRPGN